MVPLIEESFGEELDIVNLWSGGKMSLSNDHFGC